LKYLHLPVSAAQREEFASNPHKFLEFRKAIEADGNTIHGVTLKGSELQKGAIAAFQSMMRQCLAKKPEIVQFPIPSFDVGCRRLTPGPGYLEAPVEADVDFITDKISSIVPQGVVLENGKSIEIDALVCATGFNTSSPPPFHVIGYPWSFTSGEFHSLPRDLPHNGRRWLPELLHDAWA